MNFKCADDFFVKGRESGIFPHCNECCCTSNYDSATLDMPTSPVKAKSATPSKGIIRVYLEQVIPTSSWHTDLFCELNINVNFLLCIEIKLFLFFCALLFDPLTSLCIVGFESMLFINLLL